MSSLLVARYDQGVMTGIIGERFGRRTMLMAGGAIMIARAALLASYTVGQLIAGRITGVGNGLKSSTAPVYQGECSLARIRGALLTLQGTGVPLSPSGPPSSRWLAAHDRHDEARRVIAAINGRPVDDPDVGRTLIDIQSGLAEEQQDGPFRLR
ncbi:hypothetical protein DL771_010522 [Monosporascus sp. 5C6A]|nr:hypothetical protein DL771_010522 [Monosporascus sp. 5C6A]